MLGVRLACVAGSIAALMMAGPAMAAPTPAPLGKPTRAATSAAKPAASPRVIAVDVGRVKGPHAKSFRVCVGAGRANEGLRADWQQQLGEVHRECGFRYVRFHGLLHDDMGVYQESRDGQPVYNWQYVDKLYDAILAAGVKPFVELGFMPSALASGTKTIFWWKGNVTPPKSYEKWEAFIEALTRHFEDRYGRDEVKTWYFEVWNEPNLDVFWAGTQAEYFKLYAHSVRAIKRVCRDYRVGGPATAGAAWVPEFLRHCAEQNLPADFVSTHSYNVDGSVDEFGEQQLRLVRDKDVVGDDVLRVTGEIKASPRPEVELHFTEWSASYSSRDPVHDHYLSAAFILSRLKRAGEAADSLSYWTFTDVFEEGGPGPTPFHGGFGLLNLQGLRKPAFYAYQFLNRLGDTELVNADGQSWACTSREGVQILVWDLKLPAQDASNQVYFKRDLPAARLGDVRLSVGGLAPGDYDWTFHRVGYRSNDVYADYLLLGSPSWLSQAQVAGLAAQNDGSPVLRRRVTLEAGGTLTHDLEMRENDVWLAVATRR
jgi:xylan 1,4-beta-xylosidase